MPVSIIVGGQFGSEGKGKAAHYFAKENKARIAVRVGGTNSGHTVIDSQGNRYIFKMLPTAAILNNVDCLLPSGSYIDLEVLFKEIRIAGLEIKRLKIDPNAIIITDEQKAQEAQSGIRQEIGSTLSGTGRAVADRISRRKTVLLAKDEPKLIEFIAPTKEYLRNTLDKGDHIVIEGTQGYGLSVLHSEYYPFATSRDTTAAGFLSETGLSPFDVQDIVMVIRAFPIRVSGNSGPLPNEIDWQTVTKESGSAAEIIEYTSVTNSVRRVARFDADIVRKAITVNNPNIIVLNHVDYVDNELLENPLKFTFKARKFVDDVQISINRQINYIGFSPRYLINNSMI